MTVWPLGVGVAGTDYVFLAIALVAVLITVENTRVELTRMRKKMLRIEKPLGLKGAESANDYLRYLTEDIADAHRKEWLFPALLCHLRCRFPSAVEAHLKNELEKWVEEKIHNER